MGSGPATKLFSRYNDGVSFHIRQFKKADFDTLWRIDQACFDPQMAYSRAEMAYYLRRPGAFALIAEALIAQERTSSHAKVAGRDVIISPGRSDSTPVPEPAILGFIVAETRRQTGHIITIDVVAEARRLGVGSALLLAAEDRLRQSGATAVALETAVNNAPAIHFYKQKGYFVEKTIRGYYSNQLNALVMTKELVSPAVQP